MDDFILSITKQASDFIITTPDGVQISLATSILPSLSVRELGHWLYRHVFNGPILTSYQKERPGRLLLYLPAELLDWPWQLLHDGTLPLTLRHPIILLPLERLNKPAPALQLKHGPLRILLTIVPEAQYAGLGAAIERMIDTLEQHYSDRVLVKKISTHLNVQHLLNTFQSMRHPFHFWHHVGPCEPDFALKLADGTLKVHHLNRLLLDLQPGALRCFVLSTQSTAPAASRLSQLNAPLLLCQSAHSASRPDPSLFQGFYNRLLTHDLAVAGTLAQLETYQTSGEGWADLTMQAQTTELHLGLPQPMRLPSPRGEQPPVRILIMTANPPLSSVQRQNGLRIEREMSEIKNAIIENRRFFDCQEEGAIRLKDFSNNLIRYRPMLLHFSGHAYETHELLLEKYTSSAERRAGIHPTTAPEPDPISFADIARRLTKHQGTLRCVVFNACHTESLAETVSEQIECAIGMRGAIKDILAIRFSELFYRAISYGHSVGWAFHNARNEITPDNQPDQEQTFQLKCKPGVDPDTIVFVQTQEGNL